MKLQIISTIKQGLNVIIKNPIILVSIIIYAIVWCISINILFRPELLEHFRWNINSILLQGILIFLALIIYKMIYDAVKGNVSISKSINLSIRKIIFVFIAHILFYIIIGLGYIVLIIPGIFLAIKLWFFDYAILLDNKSIISSFEKSWQITEGNWWRVFGLCLIFLISTMVLVWIAIHVVPISITMILSIIFVTGLLQGWFLSTFTITYIQLTKQEDKE